MRFVSTAGKAAPVSLRQAVLAGTAADGGLYFPERLPPLPQDTLSGFRDLSFAGISLAVAEHLLGEDLSRETLERIVATGLDFDVPLVEIEAGIWCLELFHGPTLAFKDVGARFMAALMDHLMADEPGGERRVVLVATSGDTGSAIAHAFLGKPRFQVVVLFPAGQVSPLQQKQFTTLGGNVTAVAVDGTFDDCQALVKSAFADADLRSRLQLVSANSINVGRLLPQIFYYFHAAARLPGSCGAPLFATPSGNFGNLAAGLVAARLGLACQGFVAATNRNDVVPLYLETGNYEPRPSQRTLSNAMDVGNPSNFQRILHLYGGDVEAIRRDLSGSSHDDDTTRAAIRDTQKRLGYVLDPHSAVGLLGLRAGLERRGTDGPGIFLATAHAAKFGPLVEAEIGRPVPIPEALARYLELPEQTLDLEATPAALRQLLLRLF